MVALGGMQVMEWSIRFPERLKAAAIIASAPNLSTQNIAFNEVARQSIRRDPDFFDGRYLDENTVPTNGLGLARVLGHITYLSDDSMGRNLVVRCATTTTNTTTILSSR